MSHPILKHCTWIVVLTHHLVYQMKKWVPILRLAILWGIEKEVGLLWTNHQQLIQMKRGSASSHQRFMWRMSQRGKPTRVKVTTNIQSKLRYPRSSIIYLLFLLTSWRDYLLWRHPPDLVLRRVMGVPKVSPPGSSRSWTSLVKIIVAGTLTCTFQKYHTRGTFRTTLQSGEQGSTWVVDEDETYSFRRSGSFLDTLWLAAHLEQ